MADVSSTAKSQLSARNAEPSHIGGVSAKPIGGRGIDDEANTDETKIDGEADGLSADTTIPHSVAGEKSHLSITTKSPVSGVTNSGKADPVETSKTSVSFGEEIDASSTDDIDEALDYFEEVAPVDIDILTEDEEIVIKSTGKKGDDDDDDDKDKGGDSDKKPNPFAKKSDDGGGDDEGGGDDKKPNPFQKEGYFNEDEEIVIKGKGDDDSGGDDDEQKDDNDDSDDKKQVNEEDGEDRTAIQATQLSRSAVNSGPNKEDGDNDGTPEGKAAWAADAAKSMNKGGTKSEAVKIRIKLPNAKLFESAGVPKKNQAQVGLVFESVVKNVTKQISEQVAAHYQKLHEEKLAQRDAILAKQMDSYLNYVVEEWVTTNKVAIRSSLRSQLAEEFLNGLQRLFNEHYIDVPQSKVDVVEELTKQVVSLKASLNEQVTQKMRLLQLAEAANKARIVAQFVRATKLSENQIVKLERLAEDTPYDTAKDFREKLTMLTESYFPVAKKDLKTLPEETVQDEPAVAGKASADPLVRAAMAASQVMGDMDSW